jgi:DNA-binding MarR family transcriptional regulator
MEKKEFRDKILKKAKEILNGTGFLEVIRVVEEPSSIDNEKAVFGFFRPDFAIRVRLASRKTIDLLFEIKTNAQPRFVRSAVLNMSDVCSTLRNSYCVLGAPYLSEASMKICREYGIGYIDLAGNSLLNFESVFIKTEGKPNPFVSTRPLRNLFSPKSTRVLRVLLGNPNQEWYVKDIAEEAKVSLGKASNVKQRLLDYEYAEEVPGQRQKKIRLTDPEKLLKDWADNYSYLDNRLFNYYSLENPREIEERVVSFCANTGVRCALTLTSADARLTHFLRGAARSYIYIEKPLEPAASYLGLNEVDLGLKEVDSGENVTIMVPYDEGVFYAVQEVDNLNIVSDIQLYLDLQGYKQRGKDAGEFLLEQRIKKEWQT